MAISFTRRSLITLLGGATAAWPFVARGQPSGEVRRVGVLIFGKKSDPISQNWVSTFQAELQTLAWIDGRNLHLDLRFAPDPRSLQELAQELVSLAPDAILVHSSPGMHAIQQQTKAIPIVFVAVGDPIANGFVKSIARPEGNATGFTNLFPSIGGKWLELLKEAAPRMDRVGMLFNPDLLFSETYLPAIEATAVSLGVQVVSAPYRNTTELADEASAIAAKPNGGVILVPPLSAYPDEFILQLERDRLPAISNTKFFVTAGGLMSYGADNADLFRRAASYIDRVLRGEKISDLPIQFPTKFEMALNLKTAKAIGLRLPPTMRALATDVIE